MAHIDLYRLGSPAELAGIGWDEYLRTGWVVVVEWPERAADWLPGEHIRVELAAIDETRRRLQAAGRGPRAAGVVRDWERVLTKFSWPGGGS
jgi:tRNA A37 threonylcarbamoyladenosine biosynthesis protein TsaE